MLFINISSDKIQLTIENDTILLDRNLIENHFGPRLIELYRKYNFKDILLINGPGGFTNLRIATVCINLFNTLEKFKINIYDISKIELYNHLYQNKILPSLGIVYIGQKKNIRLYNFEKESYETILIENINQIKEKFFIDEVFDQEYFDKNLEKNKIKLNYIDGQFTIEFDKQKTNIDINHFNNNIKKTIEANYMINPSVN